MCLIKKNLTEGRKCYILIFAIVILVIHERFSITNLNTLRIKVHQNYESEIVHSIFWLIEENLGIRTVDVT